MDLSIFIDKLKALNASSGKPHKFLMLLSIIELIKRGQLKENKLYFDYNLKETFLKFLKQYGRLNDRNRPHTPFFHLQNSGFWYLKAKPGKEDELNRLKTVGSSGDVLNVIDYAYLDENVYELLLKKDTRLLIEEHLINIITTISNINQYEEVNYEEVNNVAEEKVKYNTASLFEHERRYILELNNKIKQFGTIVGNLLLFDEQSNNYFEYDAVAITKSGIYVIELKHWSGTIKIEPYNWQVNKTQYRNSPHKANIFKCKILKGIYQHRFRTFPDLWVESVVILTNPDSTIEGADDPRNAAKINKHNPTFSSIADFISYLQLKNNHQILTDKQVSAITDFLGSLNEPKKGIHYTVPGYETVEYISQKTDYIELLARPVRGHAKGLYRFRVFRLPHNLSDEEKQRFSKKAHNTLSAVSQMGDHPHIHKVWVFENEEGDIIEGSEWSETGTLRDIILKQKESLTIEKILQYCRGVAFALADAHKLDLIHRAVKPENILIVNDIPKIMNFDLVYQVEDSRITVIEDISQLKDDGYIAPEVLYGEDIDETTDYYSLGVIALEMLIGRRAIKSTREFKAKGGEISSELVNSLYELEVPEETINIIQSLVLTNREKRINDATKIVHAFSPMHEDVDDSYKPVNALLPPGSHYDVYEIEELIAKGRDTQVYKAKAPRQEQVVLKLFNKEVPRDRVFSEEEITKAIKSTYVVRCKGLGHWNKDRYFLVFEYIHGQTLRELIDREDVPELDRFHTVTMCLLEAVEAFHKHVNEDGIETSLVHSDIKPENIILTQDKKAVLIDCSIAGEPRVDTYMGSRDYVPPDSISGSDRAFSPDGDLFALGVTLWEWLFGQKPYNEPAVGQSPDRPQEINNAIPEQLVNWLMKSVSTEADSRFKQIEEMKKEFIECFKVTEELDGNLEQKQKTGCEVSVGVFDKEGGMGVSVGLPATLEQERTGNPFVSYLNTLSNASAGNENATAESQIGNKYFDNIFVDNPVTDHIYENLVNHKRNVVLTGNAGDGKTTIAVEIMRKIKGEDWINELNQIQYIPEAKLVIVKDMSELKREQRKQIIEEATQDSEKTFFIITNTGTFLSSFGESVIEAHNSDESMLLNALRAEQMTPILNDSFWVINIGRLNSISTACKVLKKVINPDNWKACSTCSSKLLCPIYCNVMMIQEKVDTVTQRIKLVYRRLYEYNTRLTLRQMTGHLAYSITAGMVCSDIFSMSRTGSEAFLRKALFFDRFFGDDGTNPLYEATQLLPVRCLQNSEFGAFLEPSFEREVWVKEDPVSFILDDYPESYQFLKDLLLNNNATSRRQLRRLVYFCDDFERIGSKKYISTFLRSPMILELIGFIDEEKLPRLKESQLRQKILQVLQEFFAGMRLLEKGWSNTLYITLKRHFAVSGTQLVLAELQNDDFKLDIRSEYILGTEKNMVLYLLYQGELVKMKLDLPFLDYVIRRYEGEVAEDLSAYYADRLERFKVELLEHSRRRQDDKQTLFLLTIGADRSFKRKMIAVENERLEVF